MAKKNITSYKSYNSFLRLMEESSNMSAEQIDKLDEKSLREIVDKVKSKKLTEHLEAENYLGNFIINSKNIIANTFIILFRDSPLDSGGAA